MTNCDKNGLYYSYGKYDDDTSTNRHLDDNIVSANHRKGDDMSFVGIVLTHDGVVAFGDSQSTRVFSDGTREVERGRTATKVFEYGDCLLVTHGLNEINIAGQDCTRMEDYIRKCRNVDMSFSEFLNSIRLSCSVQNDDAKYEFIIAGKEKGRYYLESIAVSRLKIEFNERLYSNKGNLPCSCCRIEHYTDDFDIFMDSIRREQPNIKAERLAEEIERLIEIESERLSIMRCFNTVGKPIDIKMLH